MIVKTSSITYEGQGQLKTFLVPAFDNILLHDPFSLWSIIGILIAIVGMGLYSYVVDSQSKQGK